MKLLQQFQRSYLKAAVLATFISAVVGYFLTDYIITHETDEELLEAKPYVEAYLSKLDTLPSRVEFLSTLIDVEKHSSTDPLRAVYTDTLDLDPLDDYELEPYRRLTYVAELKQGRYKVSISLLQIAAEEIVLLITLLCIGLGILTVLLIGLASRRASKRLWRPFNSLLQSLTEYSIGEFGEFSVDVSSAEEFSELSASLNIMTAQLSADFHRLKAFTGNASHELQTPVAIVAAQVERIAQIPNLPTQVQDALGKINEAIVRQRLLHNGLLELSKIERTKLEGLSKVDITALVTEEVSRIKDAAEATKLRISTSLEKHELYADSAQASLLVRNLLSNAVKHNIEAGWIEVSLSKSKLVIRNSGATREVDPLQIFERFYRGDTRTVGAGLGLAIAAQICQQHNWTIAFSQDYNAYNISVGFIH
jgi:signal transduction histidine kinase